MASKPTVTLEFAGDEKKLTRAMENVGKAGKDMESKVTRASSDMATQSKRATSSMSGAFKVAAGGMIASAATAGIGMVTNFLGGMAEEAREAEKVSRSTAQGIKTMGAESWTSADAIGDLSESISKKIGVDDELIQSSANLLLTFGNVKNAVGENNNVFDRAVIASQDLAAKGFGDADSAAKMLGKALNDPIKGMTALGKAGVTFTQAQKDQIAGMVESGDLLGAQKVLLEEVERQVGGTAEATASAGDKMAVTWGNFQEKLGTAILPVLDNLLGKLSAVIDWAAEHPQIVTAIGAVTVGIWLLNAALNANPIVLIVTLIASFVAALIVLWTTNEDFRNAVTIAWNSIKNTVGSVVGGIRDTWNALVEFFKSVPRRIGEAFGGLGGIISRAFKGAVNFAIEILNDGINVINELIGGINHVNPFADIPHIPHIPKLHGGGEVTGAMPGQEVLRVLQVGERVVPAGQSSGGGGGLVISGGADSALAKFLQSLVRKGILRFE
jgi:hypothetical protein